jgi:hypothetical protein
MTPRRSAPPLALVEHVLAATDQRTRTFDERMTRFDAQARAGAAPDTRSARALRDEIRRTRASLAVVQGYLYDQARLLHRRPTVEGSAS